MILFYNKDGQRIGKEYESSWNFSHRRGGIGSGKISLRDIPEGARYAKLFKGSEYYKSVLIEDKARSGKALSTSIKTLEQLFEHYRIPENWHGWDNKPLSFVLSDLVHGFRTIRRNTLQDLSEYLEIHNVALNKLYDGDLHLDYYSGDDEGVYFHQEGYITFAFDCGEPVSQRYVRWSEEVGDKVFIEVQSVSSDTPFSQSNLPNFSGVEKKTARTGIEDESALYGVQIASDKRYVAVRFTLKLVNFDPVTDFSTSLVYDSSNQLVERTVWGFTPILKAFEVITRSTTEISVETVPLLSETVSDVEFGGETLWDALKKLYEKYSFDFRLDLDPAPVFSFNTSMVTDKTRKADYLIRTDGEYSNTSISEITSNLRKVNVLHCFGSGEKQEQLYARIPETGTVDGLPPVEDEFSETSIDTLEALIEAGNTKLAELRGDDSPAFEVETALNIRLLDRVTIVSPSIGAVYDAVVEEEDISYSQNKLSKKFGVGGFRFNPIDALISRPSTFKQSITPSMPQSVRVVPVSGGLAVSWEGRADSYSVFWKKSSDTDYCLRKTNKKREIFEGLTVGVEYEFYVVAVIEYRRSEPSLTVRGTVYPGVLFQYSANGTEFHNDYLTGDTFFRTSSDGGETWTSSIPFVGPQGETGPQGPQGATGPQGVAGPKGADGITYYTWIKYATSSSGANLSDDPTGKTYIGMAYNKTTPTESINPADYTWALMQGPQGVPGAAGANGVTTYTWIKYSDYSDGTGLYDTPTDSTRFIGIATNKTTATESTNKADYIWSSFKGSIWFSGTGVTGASTTATIFSGSGVANAVVGDMYKNTSTGNTYRCTVGGSASIAKWVYDGTLKGPQGATGPQGPQGATGPQGEPGGQNFPPNWDLSSDVMGFFSGIIARVTTESVEAGCPYTYCLRTGARDTTSIKNIPVMPGQKYKTTAWINASAANFKVSFGMAFKNSSGGLFGWTSYAYVPAGTTGWQLVSGTVTVPAGAIAGHAWIQLSGFSDFGYGYVTGMSINQADAVLDQASALADAAGAAAQAYADGLEKQTIGIGLKLNYSNWSYPDAGEIYIHGFNSAGVAADVNGWIYLDNTKLTVNKAMINPNLAVDGYIVLPVGGGTPLAAYYQLSGDVFRTINAGTIATISDSDYVVIGEMVNSAGEVTESAILYPRAIRIAEIKGTIQQRFRGIADSVSNGSRTVAIRQTTKSGDSYLFTSATTRIARPGDCVFCRGGTTTTGASDNVKALRVFDGYEWAAPRADAHSSYRELALMDLAAAARVYKSAGVTIPSDIDAVFDILVTNKLLTEKMKALEIQFETFVASIAGALSPRSGSNLGTLQAFMGKQPRPGVEDDGIYKFALQEYLGMDGTKEKWMKHFWTKMMANGMIGLLLAGGLQSCGPVTSNPGQMWEEQTSPFGTAGINDTAYGNGKYVAVGASGKIAYSTDGITWTLVASSPFGSSPVYDVTYGNGKFIAVGASGKIAYSTNGITWTLVASSPFGSFYVYGVTYGNGKYVAVGWAGKIAYSTNGVTWTLVASSPFGTTLGTSDIRATVYGNGKYVAVGASGKIAYSTDGVTWTLVASSPFGSSDVRAIAYGNGKYIAVGVSGKIAYSTNGVTWTLVASSPFGATDIYGIEYGNGKYVAVGWAGKIACSTDGILWDSINVSQPFGSNGYFYGVCFSDTDLRFVAVGYLYSSGAGVIITSDALEAGAGIVEKGRSSDGTSEYTLFSDGTLVCRAQLTTTLSCTSQRQYSYYSPDATLYFPYAFKEPPIVAPVSKASLYECGGTSIKSVYTNRLVLCCYGSQAQSAFYPGYIAIGKAA